MSASGHIGHDRIHALAYLGESGDLAADREAELAHLAGCDTCAARLSRAVADAEAVRGLAIAEADQVFDEAALESQRLRILDRLAHLGQAARVIVFPARTREAAMPVRSGTRRWVSVAAAAGLIIGLVAGQLLHLIPAASSTPARESARSAPTRPADNGPMLVPTSAAMPLSEDELLEEVDSALQLRRARSLQAIDGLTPTAADFLGIGQ